MSYVSRLRTSFLIALLPLLFLGTGPSPTLEPSVFRTDDHVLISEVVVTPTADEFIEIANPTGVIVALDEYYLSDDEDYALLPGALGGGLRQASQAPTSSFSFLREPRSRGGCSRDCLRRRRFFVDIWIYRGF